MSLKAEWIPIPAAQKISPRRSGHTAFSNNKSVFVFGGYIEEDKNGEPMPHREVRNDLWQFGENTWTKKETTGDIPGPRLVSASAVVDGHAYLLGGWDPQTAGTGGIILDTVHKLHLETLEWSELPTKLPDGPTSRHVAFTLGNDNKILLHSFRCIDFVWLLDPTTGEFTKQSTTGLSPGSVGLHTATMLNDSTMLVFGGATKDGTMSNAVHRLDCQTWKWTKIDCGGSGPSSRAGACLCTYASKCAILFGGAETTEKGLNPKGDVWALTLDNNDDKGQWELLLPEKEGEDESKPEPRNAATLTEIASDDSSTTKQFLLTGGWAPFRRTWDDVFVLSLSSSSS